MCRRPWQEELIPGNAEWQQNEAGGYWRFMSLPWEGFRQQLLAQAVVLEWEPSEAACLV